MDTPTQTTGQHRDQTTTPTSTPNNVMAANVSTALHQRVGQETPNPPINHPNLNPDGTPKFTLVDQLLLGSVFVLLTGAMAIMLYLMLA